ncbi:MAG: Na+/H+ antiporter subunit E [Alphaproteobacteria bacterium]|uniref:Na+/H+ antiporter subunit E n=1 Tax=Candidatus Nitrobium versatile TaxID=2884831 RepID=A0A953J495_9BACT|nr:Na+/H+ antiporter subunit E [Candidatus Nitrobium versatile]
MSKAGKYRFALQFLLMALLWLVLTGGDLRTWWFGLPAALAGSWIRIRLLQEGRWWSIKGLVRFIPFFIRQSLEGGVDVAGRALHPHMPLKPEVIHYSVRLPGGPASVFLAAVTSLLPGTLTTELKDGHLLVHVLDAGMPVMEKLRTLEERVAALFDIDLSRETRKEDTP